MLGDTAPGYDQTGADYLPRIEVQSASRNTIRYKKNISKEEVPWPGVRIARPRALAVRRGYFTEWTELAELMPSSGDGSDL